MASKHKRTNIISSSLREPLCFCALVAFFSFVFFTAWSQQNIPVFINNKGILEYTPDKKGDRIPDFSFCGYMSGGKEIPFVPVKVVVPAQTGDATRIIQNAIDYVSALPINEYGFRGTVLLEKGTFKVNGRLKITASGVILRGSGNNDNGTILLAGGMDRETLIKIEGVFNKINQPEVKIDADYVPVNSFRLKIGKDHSFKTGDEVIIRRPTTNEWIKTLCMESFGGETEWLGWKPVSNILWDRKIVVADETSIIIDAPLTTALDKNFGGGLISKYSWNGRISNVGIENINLVSEFDEKNAKDEDHCWMAVTIENAKDCWVRQVNFRNFAGSAVAVYESSKQVTVEDCISLNPVSEIGGTRRNTFFTSGQQVLFQRCYSEFGYHDFSTGNFTPGPNAFVQCEAHLPYSFSGTADRWASGVLFDNVYIDGNSLSFSNRGSEGQGAGWTAASSMMWQCSASKIDCFAPPTVMNWAFGAWGQFNGNGYWHQPNSHVNPRSLYYTQLKDRIGEAALSRAYFLPVKFESTSSPTIEQAEEMTRLSDLPMVQLKDWILQADTRNPIPIETGDAKKIDKITLKVNEESIVAKKTINIKNGWLVCNKVVVTGSVHRVQWWRGTTRPEDLNKYGPHITRFVPGRTGTGLTDNLDEMTDSMVKNNMIAIDHNYGLWYDRRRDDHERIRRMDGDVWPPFYELPFARSGQGIAWDGLSKYDLLKPNYWYWNRIKQYAYLAGNKGLILIHQNYFQHNIIEAGAHWADFPWRTANNINNTGFPEPPNYAGEKRIFMAEQFYDITDSNRREIHRNYIKQCLNNFTENSNVIQLISHEYTGPLHFMEFWIDVIKEWENETGKNEIIGLSATKDVQDSILADPVRSKIVDLIDIKYWFYRDDSTTYAPEGGKNLAPRQHARLIKQGKSDFNSVYRAVFEYRTKFPDKAVIYSNLVNSNLHWAVFMAGGSMAAIPKIGDKSFYSSAATMKPLYSGEKGIYILENADGEKIIYSKDKEIKFTTSKSAKTLTLTWIDPEDGRIIKTEKIKNLKTNTFSSHFKGDVVLWVILN